MSRLGEALAARRDFVVTCEFVPGRGPSGKSVDAAVEFGRKVVEARLPIHAVSITDNPGGNPAIAPEALGAELQAMGLDALIHFACTDANRNLIEARAYGLARGGINNLLVVTGDYTTSGYKGTAKPIFDLDAVQVVKYLKEMNDGLKTPGRKKGTFDSLPGTEFCVGAVVSPFKKMESELMTQFFKLEKKVQAGADFIVPQLGYDIRKFAEILKYMKYRNITIPILGNVYVVNKMVAGLMNKGLIPGCVVTDGLLKALGEEAAAEDKGKKARLERAAQLMAIFRGIKFDGVHIGGFGLKAADFEHIIKRSEEIGENWRVHIPNFQYGQEGEFYLFPEDPELRFDESTMVPIELKEKAGCSPNYALNRLFHRFVFEEGAIGYKLCTLAYRICDKVKVLGRLAYFFERQIKRLLFDCQECGDCALFDVAYLCPMSKCAKSQRNGPCGGSRHGMCEVDETKKCVWTMAYRRLASIGKLDKIRAEYVPPVDWVLAKTSSWANFFMGRDHSARKLKAQRITGKIEEKNEPLFNYKSNRARTAWQIAGTVIGVGIIAVILIVLLTAAGIKGWEYSNSNAFCANACHNVHPEESVAIRDSKHSNVKCVECHMGRVGTITAMFRKAGHFKHLFTTIAKSYGRPEYSESLTISSDSCEGCHYSLSAHSATLKEVRNYLPDEGNTEKRTYFVLGAGGGDPGMGLNDGNHWHVVNKVEYAAADEERQEILWVKVTGDDGSVTKYVSEGAPARAEGSEHGEEHAEEHVKTMDCLDCHNRIGHPFTTPEKAIDEAMADGRLSRELPYIKKELTGLFTAGYDSQEEALSALDGFEQQYKGKYTEVDIMFGEEFGEAVEVSKELVARLFFKSPGVTWDQFVDNSGHSTFPGCFRCHDGKHASEEGDVIPLRCNLCHSLPASVVGEVEPPLIKASYMEESDSYHEPGFIFDHRVLADDWCGSCHGEINYGNNDSGFCSSSACHSRDWEPFSTL